MNSKIDNDAFGKTDVIRRTPTIRENLLEAIKAIEAWPEEKLDLEYFMKTSASCGTLYCAAGLLTITPFFIEQGLYLQNIGGRNAFRKAGDEDTIAFRAPWVSDMFGEGAFGNLFATHGQGDLDKELLADGYLSDKALALARLRKQLEMYP